MTARRTCAQEKVAWGLDDLTMVDEPQASLKGNDFVGVIWDLIQSIQQGISPLEWGPCLSVVLQFDVQN